MLKSLMIILLLAISGIYFTSSFAQEYLSPQEKASNELSLLLDKLAGLPVKQEKNYAGIINLVEKGADINTVSSLGLTPLLILSSSNELSLIADLIRRGADVNLALDTERALKSEQVQSASDKMKLPVEKMNITENFMTPLYMAASTNNTQLVKLLIENGAKINLSKKMDNHPITAAAGLGNTEIVEILIKDIDRLEHSQFFLNRALVQATLTGKSETVKLLLNAGAATNPDKNFIPIIIASQRGYTDIVMILLEAGANINQASEGGATALYVAAQNNNNYLLKELIKRGADVDVKLKTVPLSPIYMASQDGHVDIARTLIEAGANLNTRSPMTPIAAAIHHEHLEIIEALINAGADLGPSGLSIYNSGENPYHKDGMTALEVAVNENNPEILKLVIKRLLKGTSRNELSTQIEFACRSINSVEANKQIECIQDINKLL